MEKSTHMFKFVYVKNICNEIKTSYVQRNMQIGKTFIHKNYVLNEYLLVPSMFITYC